MEKITLEETSNNALECNHDNIGRPILCFTENVLNELKMNANTNQIGKM